ncbi:MULTISPECIES: hypothetical protein [Burkholderia]|nr:hypothetical protein [Burkholderia multivorans]MBU9389954.1 hypothetical protein [Burkholderia multivorans]MBU9676906.1 hypothetical protein [Burkholderia multivorans]MBY4792332.1 hypothetical protein [Burkholderia multivorans]MCA8220348.1 hypothetical protein [Burkholderia multivorans]MCO8579613.1 hypothetical protein [Burkholderia multivorans]
MANPYRWSFLRQHGDMFFDCVFGDSKYRVQVAHECLTDSPGSDRSREGDEKAIVSNMDRIQAIARNKIEGWAHPPIQI